jgi:hypothetical protein
MCCIIFHSFCFFSAVSGKRCILVMWYLKAAVLCSKGWSDLNLVVVDSGRLSIYIYFEMWGFSVYVQVKKVCFHFLLVTG